MEKLDFAIVTLALKMKEIVILMMSVKMVWVVDQTIFLNDEKTWLIMAPIGSIITLQFHSFHVRPGAVEQVKQVKQLLHWNLEVLLQRNF